MDVIAQTAKEWLSEILPPGRRLDYLPGVKNESDDFVSDIDQDASRLFVDRLTAAGLSVFTEEIKNTVEGKHGAFRAAVDPADGSSLLLSGTQAVGVFVGIYKPNINHWAGKELLASIAMTVGRESEMHVAYRDFGTHKFGRFNDPSSDWSAAPGGRAFLSPIAKYHHLGAKLKEYPPELLNYLISKGLSMAYFRSLAVDVNFMLGISGGSIFCYPTSRLRCVVELFPVALLVEEAGGAAYFLREDGRALTLDEMRVHNLKPHESAAIIFGSELTVKEAVTAAGYLFEEPRG